MSNPNDNRPLDDKTRDAAHGASEEVKDAGRVAGEKAKNAGSRISDAIEDVIPGDSDGDGH